MDNDSDIWVLPRASVMINQINHKLNQSTNNYVQTLPHLKPDTVVNWDIDLPSPTQHLALVKDEQDRILLLPLGQKVINTKNVTSFAILGLNRLRE